MVVLQLLDEFFGFVEVDCVGEEFLLIEAVDDSQEDAADKRCGDSDADRDEGCCDLSSSLFEGLADQRGVLWEVSGIHAVCVDSAGVVVRGRNDCTDDSSEQSLDSMQVVYSTCVVEAEFLL